MQYRIILLLSLLACLAACDDSTMLMEPDAGLSAAADAAAVIEEPHDTWRARYALTWTCQHECAANAPMLTQYDRLTVHGDTASAVFWRSACQQTGCVDIVVGMVSFPIGDQCAQVRLPDDSIAAIPVCVATNGVYGTLQFTASYPENTWSFKALPL